jgi:7-cyano-7-deazaguanine synthase
MSGSVVLLSGGVDSTVALDMAVGAAKEVTALSVDYGQRHSRELEAARQVALFYGVRHVEAKVDPVFFSGSALTSDREVPDGHAVSPDATYVPARNTVLLALAAAQAESIGAKNIVIGANADDQAAYPDCRRQYLEAFRDVLQFGTVNHVWVSAPLLSLTKWQISDYAKENNVPLWLTYSCYRGEEQPCGSCGACVSNEGVFCR